MLSPISAEGSDQEDDDMEPQEESITPVANVEPFVPREMTEEDKRLVDAMSKLTDDLLEDRDE